MSKEFSRLLFPVFVMAVAFTLFNIAGWIGFTLLILQFYPEGTNPLDWDHITKAGLMVFTFIFSVLSVTIILACVETRKT